MHRVKRLMIGMYVMTGFDSRQFMRAVHRVGVGVMLALVSGLAAAQTIDSLEWVVEGPERPVARITFNANVRFLRQAPLTNADLAQLSFEIISNDDFILGQTIEEGKKLPTMGGKPGVSLEYVPSPTVRTKMVTLRFTSRVRLLARQGPDARTIDLVFNGADLSGFEKPLPPMFESADARRYALLLKTFSDGDAATAQRVPAEFQNYAVFTRPWDEDGVKRTGLAIGYFRTQEDAETVRHRAVALFPSAKIFTLGGMPDPAIPDSARLKPIAAAQTAPGATLELTAPTVAPKQSESSLPEKAQFAVILKTFPADDLAATPRIPVEFQDYTVFTRQFELNGSKQLTLAIGYFQTRSEADALRLKAMRRFPSANVLELHPVVAAITPVTPPVAPLVGIEKPKVATANEPQQLVAKGSEPGQTAQFPAQDEPKNAPAANASLPESEIASEVNGKGQKLLGKGRLAFEKQRYQDAVDALNQALMLPPNPSSQEAQELIGFAWEGLQQPAKARMEYQLYLKLYPQGERSQKVAGRLAALDGVVASAVKPGSDAAKEPKSPYSYSGSISQYYYGGQTKTDSLVNIAAGIDQNTLSRTNQSALVTSVDVSGRYKSEDSEMKLVLRDTVSKNFVATSNSQSVLSAAYIDYRDLGSRMGLRVGRQSAIGGSLFGLFDGISLTMPVANQFKLSGTLGVPANTLVSAPAQRLAGVMLEADSLFEHWGGNLSLVDQTTEGISDRRAVGLEVRYFGEALSLFSQFDYDLNFGVLNAATLQSSMQGPFGTTLTMLLDDRKAPSLQLSDALISSGTTSLKTLLQLRSLAEVQGLALDTTARAKQALFSISRPITPSWQGSMDFRYSDVGALPAVGNFQAMPATGAQYNFSLQLTGSNLYSDRDINGINVSVLNSDTLRGTQLAYNNLTGILDNKASIEPSIRLYTQTDNTSTKVFRVSPGLRVSYKLSDRASLLGETIYEVSHTEGPTGRDDSSSYFFYMGYRYDFAR